MDNVKRPAYLDAAGLFLAGLINTFGASFVAMFVVGPGTAARQPELAMRAQWISEHSLRWQVGWLFWFAVTLSFAWSYFALGRHLEHKQPWVKLAVGLAVIAAAVDLVGVILDIVAIPILADALVQDTYTDPLLFSLVETLAYAFINVTAFGLYTIAGLLLLPAAFNTQRYPRWLAWLGVAEWGLAAIATVLLLIAPALATVPLMLSFALYAPWVWASAWWVVRKETR